MTPKSRLFILRLRLGYSILISRTITVMFALLHFQGLVDVAKEVTKLEGKKEKLNGQLGKLREAMEIADYVTKVQ